MRKLLLDFDKINSDFAFEKQALKLFKYQYEENKIYRSYCDLIKIKKKDVSKVDEIPFLPINFFRTHNLNSSKKQPDIKFVSSRTTSQNGSTHFINDVDIYIRSFEKGFEYFYGDIEDYVILALLPNYIEQKNSSLIFMIDRLIKKTKRKESGFYLDDWNDLRKQLDHLENKGQKTILFGVTFALIKGAKKFNLNLKNTIVMETGGMKGMHKELVRNELHDILKKSFGVSHIHSEYGMTEILSQAYSMGDGFFKCPPWMRVYTRSIEDPFEILGNQKTGAINIIDLANIDSCGFIATEDLGKLNEKGCFEVLGRFDNSEIRGCNLLVV